MEQLRLFPDVPDVPAVMQAVRDILRSHAQPSAWDLIDKLERRFGLKVRWVVEDALQSLVDDQSLTSSERRYLRDLWESDDWRKALHGDEERPAKEIESTIDALIHKSRAFKSSAAFQEMISFMANFRDYAPFNNMLVKLQNPSCSYFATQKDWQERFGRRLKEDARPMLILAPMHPVMLVYELDSTEGPPLPEKLQQFARFEGVWDPSRLSKTIDNAVVHDHIRVDMVKLSSTNAGFATISFGPDDIKMRIGLHNGLDEPSRYGVLLHELGHIFLGHLGGDENGWWPSRSNLKLRAMEIEAEAVAYIVSRRAGLTGASPQYVSGYLNSDSLLDLISMDMIAKVAGRLDKMGTSNLGRRRQKNEK